jgi:hypothetical protein
MEKPFHLSGFSLFTQEKKKNDINYHLYYSTMPSRGSRGTDEGMYNANKSEADALGFRGHPLDPLSGLRYTRIQAAQAWSLTPESATRWKPTPIGYPSRPR